jgi:hypothetical protein
MQEREGLRSPAGARSQLVDASAYWRRSRRPHPSDSGSDVPYTLARSARALDESLVLERDDRASTALRLVCSASAISAAVCSGGSQISNHAKTRPKTGGSPCCRAKKRPSLSAKVSTDGARDARGLSETGGLRPQRHWPQRPSSCVRASEVAERPASKRDHCAVGRPFVRHIWRLISHRCGRPAGESSHFSWRPYTVRSISA